MKEQSFDELMESGFRRLSYGTGFVLMGVTLGVGAYCIYALATHQAGQYIAALILVAVYLRIGGRDAIRHIVSSLGFRPCAPRFYWIATGMLVVGLAVTAASFAAIMFAVPSALESLALNPPAAEVVERVSASPRINLDLLSMVLLNPVIEECLFRGFIYQFLARMSRSSKAGIVLSAVIFAVAHLSAVGFIGHFAGGLMLAWLFAKSKSIYPSIVLHVLNNGAAAAAMFLLQP